MCVYVFELDTLFIGVFVVRSYSSISLGVSAFLALQSLPSLALRVYLLCLERVIMWNLIECVITKT